MKKFITLALLAATLSSRADVVIYTQTATETVGGNSTTTAKTHTGFFVLSSSYGATEFDVFAKSKTFSVNTDTNYTIKYVRTSPTKTRVVFGDKRGVVGATWLKGTMSHLNVGTLEKFDAPLTFTLSGFYLSDDVEPTQTTVTGVAAFDSRRSKAFNALGYYASDAVAALRAYLIGKGYTEVPD